MSNEEKIIIGVGILAILFLFLHGQLAVPAQVQKINLVPQQQADLQAAQTKLQDTTGVANLNAISNSALLQQNDALAQQAAYLAAQNNVANSQATQTNAIFGGLTNLSNSIFGN